MRCNIIGAGRVGKNIGLALSTAAIISLQAILNKSLSSAQQAATELDLGEAVANFAQLPSADVTWIAVNDDALPTVVDQLVTQASIQKGSFIVHCSGVLSSDILAPLIEQGCFIASMHPLKAFRTGYLTPDAFLQVDCVIEGDEEVCAWLMRVFGGLGAHVVSIKPEAKAMYHAAACIASNYLITLAAASKNLLLKAGIPDTQAMAMISRLMQGNINNMQATGEIAGSLTGPLIRGDSKTLQLHLQAIDDLVVKKLYKAAGLATLPITGLDEHKKRVIEELLEE